MLKRANAVVEARIVNKFDVREEDLVEMELNWRVDSWLLGVFVDV